MKKTIITFIAVIVAVSCIFASGAQEALKVGVPDDATNQARAIKLLETAGLIKVDPSAGFSPELKDVTEYLYNIEIVPTTANTLTSTLDDYGAATINGTYATSYGLVPSKDALLIETQDEGGNNPFVNIITARIADRDNATYKAVCDAFHNESVAEYMLAKYKEAYFPAFKYNDTSEFTIDNVLEKIDAYKTSKDGKKIVKVGVCGSSNDHWKAVQYELDKAGKNIYIQLVEFDAYNLPNEALDNGDIDLNSFQHKAYMNKEISAKGYKIEAIADTLIAPLSLYSKKASSLDEFRKLAGAKN